MILRIVKDSIKVMVTTKEVSVPIYQGDLQIVFTDEMDSLNRKYKEYNLDDLNNYNALYFHVDSDEGRTYHLVFDKKKITVGIIAHECLHFVLALAEFKGLELSANADEALSYLLQWAVDECFDALTKLKDIDDQ